MFAVKIINRILIQRAANHQFLRKKEEITPRPHQNGHDFPLIDSVNADNWSSKNMCIFSVVLIYRFEFFFTKIKVL